MDMGKVAKAKNQSQSNAKKTWRDDFTKKYNAAKTDAERYKIVNEYQKMMAKGGAIANDSYMKNVLNAKVTDMQQSGYLGKDGKPYSQQELNAALADQSWGSPDVKENLAYYGVPGKENTQQAKDSEKALKAVADDIKTGNAAGENFKEYTKTDSGKRYTGMAPSKPTINGSTGTDVLPPEEQPKSGNPKPEQPKQEEPKKEEKDPFGNYLLYDMILTGVKNALHYRPSHRTAYGQSYDGRDFGNEKSFAAKLAEENMKRGLERSNARADSAAQTQQKIENTKTEYEAPGHMERQVDMQKWTNPVQKQWSQSNSNVLGSTSTSGSDVTYNPVQRTVQTSN